MSNDLKLTKVNLKRQNLILFVVEFDNQSASKINNHGMNPGMSYLNRFVADENDQFEVYAFYRIRVKMRKRITDFNNWAKEETALQIKKAVKKYAEQSKRDKTDTNTVHFIWADHKYDLDEILRTIKNEMTRVGLKKGMVSFLQKHRYRCVTKEKYEQLYENGGEIDGGRTKLSLGDDLEDFLNRIKNNEIHDHELGQEDNWINTFHLSMLSPEQKRKLAISDNDYLKTFHNHDPDIPKTEMAKSESKSKYAFSLCRRATYNISPEIHLPEEKREPLGMVARDGLPPGTLSTLSGILQLEKDCPGLDVRLPQGWKKIVSETGETLMFPQFRYMNSPTKKKI